MKTHEAIDRRSDLFSFGAVLYRAITGRAPFAARDTPSLLYAVTHDTPLRPSALAPVPDAIEQFLAVALAKPREVRFQSASELVAAFQAARGGALPAELARRAASLPPWREPAPAI